MAKQFKPWQPSKTVQADRGHYFLQMHVMFLYSFHLPETNSKAFGEMGGVILVLNMILCQGLKSQDKIQLVLTLAHAVEAYGKIFWVNLESLPNKIILDLTKFK